MTLARQWKTPARAMIAAAALFASTSPLPVQAQSVAPDVLTALRQRPPQDEVIYFLLPDRFANGDPSNDHGGYAPERLKSG